MDLSKQTLALIDPKKTEIPTPGMFVIPEKVLQFGTGVLLRGLPDYFIDQANKRQIFNGRIVVVKSTATPDGGAFEKQDNIYTICVRGLENGAKVERNIINSSISRVLSAKSDWPKVLACAADPNLQIVLSNTTEVGIVLVSDDLNASPPESFPGKLLAFLLKRYTVFAGDPDKGMVIIPTELIPDNGKTLAAILLALARQNGLDKKFLKWLQHANHYCSSLVDRIVPGKLPPDQQIETERSVGYRDQLMIMAEPYCLWAIESDEKKVRDILSFSLNAEGLVIAADIHVFRELKIRLLNGPHTFSCGLAYLSGFRTVKEAMDDPAFFAYVNELMFEEIIPAISSQDISEKAAADFARKVLDRFSNPQIRHQWLSITLQYCSKMKMRNVPILQSHYGKFSRVPTCMAKGFAAHLLFMKCIQNPDEKYYGQSLGRSYAVTDASAPYFAKQWENPDIPAMVNTILKNEEIWGTNLSIFPGFESAVTANLRTLMELNTDR